MPSLSELVSDKSTIDVPFGEHSISVTWRPSAFTPAFLSQSSARGVESLVREICDLVTAWDLTDENGPIPLTPEGVAEVPVPVLQAIDSALGKEFSLGEADASSDAG